MTQPGDRPLPPPNPDGTSGPDVPPGVIPSPGVAAEGVPVWSRREHREGDLTTTWRILLGLAWATAFFAYAAVWQASVQLGIGTWWIGPRADPTRAVLRLLPFVVCLTMVLLVVYGVRNLPRIGIALGLGMAVFALPDLSRSVGLALTELLIAAALVATSAASAAGRYRRPPGPAAGGADAAGTDAGDAAPADSAPAGDR